MKKHPNDLLITIRAPHSPVAECFRSIRTHIRFASRGREVKSILVTSANAKEGKSLLSANLAAVMAQNQTTLFVDADMRRPTGHLAFRLPNHHGLSNYLSGECDYDEIVQHTVVPGLFAVTAGPVPLNPLELLETGRLNQFLATASEQFDAVVIDSPPLIVSDGVVLAAKTDGCILVLDSKSTSQDDGTKAVEQLRNVGANLLGAVLNKADENTHDYYY